MAADWFVELPIETDAATLADDAVQALKSAWPAWAPVDADLEIVMLEALAPMAQNAAEVAARMPAAALRTYGTAILGVAYTPGTPALATVTFALADALPHTLPAGTQIIIDGYAFETTGDASTPGGSTIDNVPVQATEVGVAANDLTGASTSGITTPPWISGITVDAPTAGGSDPEDDTAYIDRLSRTLLLQATSLITLRDFELWALNYPGVGRALAITTAARAVSVYLTDAAGEIPSSPIKAAVLASFQDLKEVNTTVTMADPTYTTVPVAYTVKAYPGFDAVDLEARIDAAIAAFLDPASWGLPQPTAGVAPSTWVTDDRVRLNKVIGLIEAVPGANYVTALTLNAVAADYVLSGTVPLTRAGTIAGTIT